MAKRNQVTSIGRFFIARHIRLTSTSGRQGAVQSWTSEKEVKQAAGSHESKGAETAGRSTTRQAGRGGGRELQDNEGHAVSNGKPLTVGAIHP